MTMDDSLEKLDKLARDSILEDAELKKLLSPALGNETDTFIKGCLRKIKTRRALLRLQWLSEIAEGMENVKENRPALKLVFLMALAEGISKRINKSGRGSFKAIQRFFDFISKEDRRKLLQSFRRALLSAKHHNLRFSSIIQILYDVRNRAVHGEDFWSFSLLDAEQKQKEMEKYTHYALMTEGWLGTPKKKKGRKTLHKKKRVTIETTLTYEELRDIFIRTAIANIQSAL